MMDLSVIFWGNWLSKCELVPTIQFRWKNDSGDVPLNQESSWQEALLEGLMEVL